MSESNQARIRAALDNQAKADQEVRDAILGAIADGDGLRAVAEFADVSTSTINRWKRGD